MSSNPSIIQQTIENLNEINGKDNQQITQNTIASVELRSGCVSDALQKLIPLNQILQCNFT